MMNTDDFFSTEIVWMFSLTVDLPNRVYADHWWRNLSVRARKTLIRLGITEHVTKGGRLPVVQINRTKAMRITEDDLLACKGCGPTTTHEILEAFDRQGIVVNRLTTPSQI